VTEIKGLVLVNTPSTGSPEGIGNELTPLANRPLIAHALDGLSGAGVREAAVVAGRGQLAGIEEALAADGPDGVRIHYIEQPRAGGSEETLGQLTEFAGDSAVIAHPADALLWDPLEPFLGALAASSLDALVLLRERQQRAGGAVLDMSQSRLLGRLDRAGRDAERLECTGFYVFGPGALEAAAASAKGTASQPPLAAAVELLVASGRRVETRTVARSWRFTGDTQQLLEANRLVLEHMVPAIRRDSIQGSEIQGRVAIDPTADVSASTIRGPVVIGPRARISDSYIGPYTSIGADAVVEGTELEYSILFPKATISHVGARLEASVIGRGARVVRDFRLPTAVHLEIGDSARVTLA
jgi:glucose-1-phosphate thymidylyltransferase